MVLVAVTWRQTAADVILISAAVTAVLVLWARLFAGPIGRWIDARITKFVEPLHRDLSDMKDANSRQHAAVENKLATQHAEVQTELRVLATRLDDHLLVQGDKS